GHFTRHRRAVTSHTSPFHLPLSLSSMRFLSHCTLLFRAASGAVCLLVGAAGALRAQGGTDSTITVRFGAFVDGYYAWDFNRPRALDRAYTTQPARHNEFNVNLAY